MTGRSDAVKGADENPALAGSDRPMLLFFTSQTDGRCRRAEGFLAQVLQRRHNHDTFSLRFVDQIDRPDLLERFRVLTDTDADGRRGQELVCATLVEPRGCDEIQAFLSPWLH